MTPQGEKTRLLQALRKNRPELSLKRAKKLIEHGCVKIKGRTAKLHDWIDEFTCLEINDPAPKLLQPIASLSCHMLKISDDYIFFEKTAGIHSVAHDTSEKNSAANWLLSQDADLTALHPLECGLVHRLDFATSGVMVAARRAESHQYLSTLFRERKVEKIYTCLVDKPPPATGVYENFAESSKKSSKRVFLCSESPKYRRGLEKIVTEILFSTRHQNYWRVTVRLITGYRHQIRVHLAALGAPLLGDSLYGGTAAPRLMLHASKIAFTDIKNNLRSAESPVPF